MVSLIPGNLLLKVDRVDEDAPLGPRPVNGLESEDELLVQPDEGLLGRLVVARARTDAGLRRRREDRVVRLGQLGPDGDEVVVERVARLDVRGVRLEDLRARSKTNGKNTSNVLESLTHGSGRTIEERKGSH